MIDLRNMGEIEAHVKADSAFELFNNHPAFAGNLVFSLTIALSGPMQLSALYCSPYEKWDEAERCASILEAHGFQKEAGLWHGFQEKLSEFRRSNARNSEYKTLFPVMMRAVRSIFAPESEGECVVFDHVRESPDGYETFCSREVSMFEILLWRLGAMVATLVDTKYVMTPPDYWVITHRYNKGNTWCHTPAETVEIVSAQIIDGFRRCGLQETAVTIENELKQVQFVRHHYPRKQTEAKMFRTAYDCIKAKKVFAVSLAWMMSDTDIINKMLKTKPYEYGEMPLERRQYHRQMMW